MTMSKFSKVVVLAVIALLSTSDAFSISSSSNNSSSRNSRISSSTKLNVKSSVPSINTSGKGFAPAPIIKEVLAIDETENDDGEEIDDEEIRNELIMKMNPTQIKEKLLDLLPRMKGLPEEFQQVESYVNALEDKFVAPQTLDFLNLAMVGEWQFLFTTNQLGRPSPKLRLTELVQKIDCNGLNGRLTNRASWDLAQDESTFDASGSFASVISYKINQGARMTISDDHDLTIKLAQGSVVPDDTQALVGLIHRAMPTELFDSSDLAMDTSYLDTDIRIVRFTGARHEGVRNIFMRKGLIEINPSGMD